MELPYIPTNNPRKFNLTEEDIKWFDDFFQSKEFAEALAIVWGFGSHLADSFVVRNADSTVVERFSQLVRKTRPLHPYECKDKAKPYTQWVCGMHHLHPFVLKIKSMGWVGSNNEDKPYPKGSFDEEVFVKMYIKLHHSLDKSYSTAKKYTRPRLRIHGTADVLSHISHFLFEQLNVGEKKVQNHKQTTRTKTLQYTSKLEIPQILNYVNAAESIKKFDSLKLGY